MKTILIYMTLSTLIGALLLLDPSIVQLANIFVTLLLGLIGIFYVKGKVKSVEGKLDGKLTQLLEVSKKADKAEGKEERRAEEKVEKQDAASIVALPTEVTIVENKDK